MTSPLSRLNEADWPIETISDLRTKLSPEMIDELKSRFGLVGEYGEVSFQLAKVLLRYQAAAKNALLPDPSPQSKEIDRLKKSIVRTLAAFETISNENKSLIDGEILYRDPFNSRFYFKEQLDYWEKNEGSTQTAINKLAQISHAIDRLKSKRIEQSTYGQTTINTPLDHLIQDLTMVFERGTSRKAKSGNYYNSNRDNYDGQYFEFVLCILIRFAPSSFHSQGALGKRIERTLAQMFS